MRRRPCSLSWREAPSIRKPGSLGPWLHGVALRVARQIHRKSARRRTAERQNAVILNQRQRIESGIQHMEPSDLHEEIDRLPAKYRRPIILCYLQSKTQTEAAAALGWPLGTVQIRLHRGRALLKSRIVRGDAGRNEPSKTALLGLMAMPAGIPDVRWRMETSRAAVRFSRGLGTSGLVEPEVVRLAESTLTGLLMAPMKAIGLLIFVAIVAASGLIRLGAISRPVATSPVSTEPGTALARPISHKPAGADRPREAAATEVPPHSPASNEGRESSAVPLDPVPTSPGPVPQQQAAARLHPTSGTLPSLALLARRPEMDPDPGRELFERVWIRDDPRSRGGDGLGPVFNAQACASCHFVGGIGGAGGSDRNIEIASFSGGGGHDGTGYSYSFSMDFGSGRMEYRFGGLPNTTSTSTRETRSGSREMAAVHPGFAAARSVVLHRFGTDPSYNAWRGTVPGQHGWAAVQISERNPPPLFGSGLIDAIPDEALEAAARRRPSGQSALRGRVSRLADGRIGRFGWKAQTATLKEFVLSAAAGEMGLEVPGRHQAADPRLPGIGARGLDMDQTDCDALVQFVRSLPEPLAIRPDDKAELTQIKSGEELFRSLACAGCHLPKLGNVAGIYSDLLLHDMGPDLADADSYAVFTSDRVNGPGAAAANGPGADSIASTREWRTPPLWGLRDSAPTCTMAGPRPSARRSRRTAARPHPPRVATRI